MNNPLALLADPPARYVDGALMDYLIIETVSALRVSATVSAVRAKKIEQEMAEAGLLPPPPVLKSHEQRDSIGSTTARSSSYVDEEDEGLRSRLEAMGLHVGANLAERLELSTVLPPMQTYLCRLSRDRPLFSDSLDAIKFICKELWVACWDKQVDNLRTNHRVGCIHCLYMQAIEFFYPHRACSSSRITHSNL